MGTTTRLGRALTIAGIAALGAVQPAGIPSALALPIAGTGLTPKLDPGKVVDPVPTPTPTPTPGKGANLGGLTVDPGTLVFQPNPNPIPTVAPNCNRSGEKVFGVGSTGTARGEVSGKGSIFAVATKQDATLEGKVRGCFIGQCANLARDIEQDPMHPGSSRGVWVVADQRKGRGAVWGIRPRERRRTIGAVVGVGLGNGRPVVERGTCELKVHEITAAEGSLIGLPAGLSCPSLACQLAGPASPKSSSIRQRPWWAV